MLITSKSKKPSTRCPTPLNFTAPQTLSVITHAIKHATSTTLRHYTNHDKSLSEAQNKLHKHTHPTQTHTSRDLHKQVTSYSHKQQSLEMQRTVIYTLVLIFIIHAVSTCAMSLVTQLRALCGRQERVHSQ